jgi:hypothetical protein
MIPSSLKGEHLALLGVLWPGERTPLSPFLPFGDSEEQERVRSILKRAGLADSSGSVISPIQEFLETLATPSRTVTADFMRPDQFRMVSHFFSGHTGKSFIHVHEADGSGQGFSGSVLPDLKGICDTGDLPGNRAAAPFDLTLDRAEAQILAVMLDAERDSAVQAITNAKEPANISLVPAILTKPAIQERLTEGTEKPDDRIFLGLLNSSIGEGQSDTTVPVDAEIADLVNRHLVRESGDGYGLPEPLLAVARRAVFIDTAVTFRIRDAGNPGKGQTESGYCIRADGMLFWCISPTGAADRIHIRYLPSDQLDAILRCLISDPSCSLMHGVKPELPQKQKPRFCPQCGAQLTEGKQFCGTCGARIS